MRVYRAVPAFLLSTFLSALLPAAAQKLDPTPGPKSTDNVVQMDVAVTTKNGDPVTGLTAADFTLLEDKKQEPLLEVKALSAGQVPTEGILLIDDVNARITTIANERQQIDRFLHARDGKLPFPIRIAVMTDTGTQLGRVATADGNALAAELDQTEIGLRELRHDSGFYGAVDRFRISVQTLGGLITSTEKTPGRKVILWISPGWPTLSGPGVSLTYEQEMGVFMQVTALSTAMRKQDVVVYHVNPLGVDESVAAENYYETFLSPLRKPQDAQYGNLNLQVIAVQSGGLVITSNDITAMLTRCVNDAASFYRIRFNALPADRAITFHGVQVMVNRPDAVARTRSGYYVEP
jgi:VWFA-related protein